MRILMVHNRYQIRGGEDECFEADVQLLRQRGHVVDVYEETNDRLSQVKASQLVLQTIWSRSAYRSIQTRLATHPYDVVHVQNFFPLISPSVYHAACHTGVPVVQTLHNYRLLCPNALFYRNGQVCTDCLGKPIPYPGVQHRCYRNSPLASAGVATMLSIHNLMQTWIKTVDRYIALTEFARQVFIAGGLPAEKIVVKPHFIHPDPGIGSGKGGYALYVGRLSVEKGLDTLLAAWERLDQTIPLKIIGDGPLAPQVQAAADRLAQVEWLGRKPVHEVYDLIGEATCLIFPSQWYETFGRVAVEAFAKGTPVVASNIGAIAELVDAGRTGLHFQPGNIDDLVNTVLKLVQHPEQAAQMRLEARKEFEDKYSVEHHYQQIMTLYAQLSQKPVSELIS
ncbi:glycosyltransferase family 4 protein [Thermoleptolyngbya sp.]